MEDITIPDGVFGNFFVLYTCVVSITVFFLDTPVFTRRTKISDSDTRSAKFGVLCAVARFSLYHVSSYEENNT